MKSGNRRAYPTDIAQLIETVCDRRGVSLRRLSIEVGCDHSYISRLRSGARIPSRQWVERFIVKCSLTKDEALRTYEIFRYVPPGYCVVPADAARKAA